MRYIRDIQKKTVLQWSRFDSTRYTSGCITKHGKTDYVSSTENYNLPSLYPDYPLTIPSPKLPP